MNNKYDMVCYVFNEVDGVTHKRLNPKTGAYTERIVTTSNMNVVRDYKGDEKAYWSSAYNQLKVKTGLYVVDHRYTMEWQEIPGQNRGFYKKSSIAINIAYKLYQRGIAYSIFNYKTVNKDAVGKERYELNVINVDPYEIEDSNEFWEIIINQKLCGEEPKSKAQKFGFKDRNGNIVDEFKKSSYETKEINLTSVKRHFKEHCLDIKDYFRNDDSVVKVLDNFKKYAELLEFNANDLNDFISYAYMATHMENDFISSNKFKCPYCGSIVHVNGHEEFINGKYINTNETICECCYEEFDIHDKQDIINLYSIK